MDFDGDGVDDIISGSDPGNVYLFRGKGKGEFEKGVILKDKSGKEIIPASDITAFATDWDADGDLDLLFGQIMGGVELLVNEGTRKQPKYATETVKLEAGSFVINDGGHTGAVASDWDGDGKEDLVVGGDYGVHWYRNIGKQGKPEYAKGVMLVASGSNTQWAPKDGSGMTLGGGRLKPHVVDFNGDGKVDLLVGDYGSHIVQKDNLTEKEQTEMEKLKRRDAELSKVFSQIMQERDKLLDEEFTAEQRKEYWAVARPRLSGKVIERLADESRAVKEGHKYVDRLDELHLIQDPVKKALEKFKTGERETFGSVWLYLRK
ncbi:MAG: VCBS repeat-containing protein [Planctomycetes bacterium]|nr:VCBS repeat-containing protein [Planctomycetota bacterium]